MQETLTSISDSEYSHIPFSPSKINRSRIKPIPRLSQRKTSFSASESEDETRKYGRIRNNSVCSIASVSCAPPEVELDSSVAPPKETIALKKTTKNDQSRKLAEARREFNKRFGTTNPDKQKLKMIDLIFYNPLSNPLTKKDSVNKPQPIKNQNQEIEAEQVDDPEEKESEENFPAPQIKIGASGEIIVDEQSLVVENTALTKQREKIQNSQGIEADWDTSYGVYKKVARSKEWNQKETLRFYKVLNLIGSDFTVMTQLFPKRTRRELKMKFKKEEKINKHLIDKALMDPSNYNFNDLKRELEIEDEEEATLEQLRQDELKKIREKKKRGSRKRRGTCDALSSEFSDSTEYSKEKNGNKPKRTKMKPLNIKSVLHDWDADVSETQSETEDEKVESLLKPTRSGRIPKIVQRFSCTTAKYQSSMFKANLKDDQLVPGSLVLVALDNKKNESEYKVYMITDQKELVPVEIESDVIEQLLKRKQESKLIMINEPTIPKHNFENSNIEEGQNLIDAATSNDHIEVDG